MQTLQAIHFVSTHSARFSPSWCAALTPPLTGRINTFRPESRNPRDGLCCKCWRNGAVTLPRSTRDGDPAATWHQTVNERWLFRFDDQKAKNPDQLPVSGL